MHNWHNAHRASRLMLPDRGFFICLFYTDFIIFYITPGWSRGIIVSSSVYIVLSGPRIAMSGRSETNTFDNGLYSTPSKSTKTVRFGLLFEIIQSTRIFRTLSCRVLYRSRAIFELQHDNTCLLDWMFRHRGAPRINRYSPS